MTAIQQAIEALEANALQLPAPDSHGLTYVERLAAQTVEAIAALKAMQGPQGRREAFEAHCHKEDGYKPQQWKECHENTLPERFQDNYQLRVDQKCWLAWQAGAAWQAQQPQADAVPWRDHVEQRLLTWRQRFVNKSGDQLELLDFMSKRSMDDLIDFVCDEYAAPKQPEAVPGMVLVPPPNCRQRQRAEGKAYPRSSCNACGKFSPRANTCDALLGAAPKGDTQ